MPGRRSKPHKFQTGPLLDGGVYLGFRNLVLSKFYETSSRRHIAYCKAYSLGSVGEVGSGSKHQQAGRRHSEADSHHAPVVVDLVGQPAPQQTKYRIHRGEQEKHEAHLPARQWKLTVRSSSSDKLVVVHLLTNVGFLSILAYFC